MNKVEYRALKKMAMTQLGADDAESLHYFADLLEKRSKRAKWVTIFLVILFLPFCLIGVGIILEITVICVYVFHYRKLGKKAQKFREYVNNDGELSAV